MEKDKSCSTEKCCCCPCHKMNGILLVLIGVAFLLGTFEVISQKAQNIAWPILLILLGLKNSFGKGKCRCCASA